MSNLDQLRNRITYQTGLRPVIMESELGQVLLLHEVPPYGWDVVIFGEEAWQRMGESITWECKWAGRRG